MAIAYMDPAKTRFLTIHCAATPEGRVHTAAEISAWDTKKFGQVSYHHVVELDGKVTRTLRDDQKGAHVGDNNTGNIGICYVGGVDKAGKPKDTRTAEQKAALEQLVRHYLALYPSIIIRGHRDWSKDLNGNGKIDSYEWMKSCPSFEVSTWLREIGL